MNSRDLTVRTSNNIRSILSKRGESIESLASNGPITLSSLKRRLAGQNSYTIDEVGLLAAYLNVGIGDLIKDAPSKVVQRS
jgi:transcriptional regulator with XRE-family HTH domain